MTKGVQYAGEDEVRHSILFIEAAGVGCDHPLFVFEKWVEFESCGLPVCSVRKEHNGPTGSKGRQRRFQDLRAPYCIEDRIGAETAGQVFDSGSEMVRCAAPGSAQSLTQESSFFDRIGDDDSEVGIDRSQNDEVQEAHASSTDDDGTAFSVLDVGLIDPPKDTGGRFQKGGRLIGDSVGNDPRRLADNPFPKEDKLREAAWRHQVFLEHGTLGSATSAAEPAPAACNVVGRHQTISWGKSGHAGSHLVHDPHQFMSEDSSGGLGSVVQLEEICAAESAPHQAQKNFAGAWSRDRSAFDAEIAVGRTGRNTHVKGRFIH